MCRPKTENMLCGTTNILFCLILACALYDTRVYSAILNPNKELKSNMDSLVSQHFNERVSNEHQKSRVKRQDEDLDLDISQLIGRLKYPIIDLVVVMDRSWGMGKRDFYLKQKKAVRSIINQYLYLHVNYVHLAVVTFAKTVEVPLDNISPTIEENQGFTRAELFQGSNPPWEKVLFKQDPEISKGTYVHLALRRAYDILQAGATLNRNAVKMVILITDGDYKPQNDSVTIEEADRLKDNGTFIYGIGLGSWLNIANVRQLVSYPTFYGYISDWEEAMLKTPGTMTTATADTPALWHTLSNETEYCGRQCTNGRCDTDIITGRTMCRCNKGFYLNNQDQQCVECTYHTYKDSVGNEQCKSCATVQGYGTEAMGSTSPDQCVCQASQCTGMTCTQLQCDIADKRRCEHVNATTATCTCNDGFIESSTSSCLNVDNCAIENLCQNGATCLDAVDTYICVCDWGLMGRYCETRVNECSHQEYGQPLCENNGTCLYQDYRNDFSCICPEGYSGYFCQDYIGTTTTTTSAPPAANPAPEVPDPGSNTGPASKEEKDNNDLLIIIIAASLGGLLLIIVIIIVACCVCAMRRKKRKEQQEKMNDELDKQLRKKDGSRRYTKKQRQLPKTISQKFSGFWKKKTVRGGGTWSNAEGITEGTPSAPPKRRPDLLSSAVNPNYDLNVVDEVYVGNTVIEDPGNMGGWKSYLSDLENAGMIKAGTIANMDGGKSAVTQEYIENNDEIDKLLDIVNNKEVNVSVYIQKWEFEICENDSQTMSGTSVDEKMIVVVGRTRTYVVVLIAPEDVTLDKLCKEVEYITDHISSEGY